jgi:hypothetical protein
MTTRGPRHGDKVRRYLEQMLQEKAGRKPNLEAVQARLDEVNHKLGVCDDALELLVLTEQRLKLVARLAAGPNPKVEEDFVASAKEYGDRKGISYAAWREVGVSAAVLHRAGIYGNGGGPPPEEENPQGELAPADDPV